MNSIGERKFAFFYYSTNTIIYHEYRLLSGLVKENLGTAICSCCVIIKCLMLCLRLVENWSSAKRVHTLTKLLYSFCHEPFPFSF